ncbi:hypothetical protein [Streptomyces telluris]|uniref:hypothetical protein n=1 Tax=Streptomyces telluris TaxID=2720021 RepID=UPI0019D08DB3
MKIAFLIHNAYGIGGTIRATGNLASALAARHDVEIISVHRGADAPKLPADRRTAPAPAAASRSSRPGTPPTTRTAWNCAPAPRNRPSRSAVSRATAWTASAPTCTPRATWNTRCGVPSPCAPSSTRRTISPLT